MKPIEEILKEVEEYEKLKSEATQGEWYYITSSEAICSIANDTNGIVPNKNSKWSALSEDAAFIAYAHNWSPETIIRELVEENKRLNNVLFYHGRKD